jgi:hypothetical protein
MCLFLGTFEPLVVFVAIGFMILIIYLIWWLTNNPGFFDWWHEASHSGNATLTCKNGHSCRVWVDLFGWNSDYDEGFYYNDIVYNIEGHEVRRDSKVNPQFCPECGAEWLVPNKHKNTRDKNNE